MVFMLMLMLMLVHEWLCSRHALLPSGLPHCL
jgi:hypothetical protein